MCTVCGCGNTGDATFKTPHNLRHDHAHDHDHHHEHDHDHGHGHGHAHSHAHHSHHVHDGAERVGSLGAVHAPGVSHARIVQVERDILGENDRLAADNRAFLASQRILALNLVSGPGSGKTTLLVRTIDDLKDRFPIAVIEGDQQTAFDAERIRAAGVPSVQINTGKGCHLDAHMVGHAMERLRPQPQSLLFIENVGNLVCPAAFDLGEAGKVVMLSVTEGEDKPLKYPDMFHASTLMLLTKIDLLPHVPFDVDRCLEYARRVNPGITMLQVSALSGEGLPAWYDWIEQNRLNAGAATAAVSAAQGS
ncbi:MAG: hydrogenase nickel incorporation protein HypB [Rhodospirillales bacterium]|nr:hydrogenase nickel incorporation protein HypB [Rhodospirillales bacterium]